MTLFSCVRNPVRGADVDAEVAPPAATLLASSITTTSGTTPAGTLGADAINVPSGYSQLMVYVGEMPQTRGQLDLYIKIDNGTPKRCEMFDFGWVCVHNVAGKKVAFASQTRAKTNMLSATNESVAITVIPHRGKKIAPTGEVITIHPDQSPPGLWTVDHVHVVLQDEYQTIEIQPAAYPRNIFIVEANEDLTSVLPARHIFIPENQARKVDCRHRLLAFAHLTSDDIEIKFPIGAFEVENRNVKWRPPFTPTASTTVNSVSSLKSAMNGSTYDDILLSPGTYDFTASGDKINPTNYSAAMARNLRIRSSTGNPNDVTFNFGLDVSLSGGKTWVFEGIKWSMDGVAAPSGKSAQLTFRGNVHLFEVVVFGVSSTSGDIASIVYESATSTGPTTSYIAWSTLQKSARDILASNNNNSQQCTVHMYGGVVDGCGPNPNDQVITTHFGGIFAGWGVRLKDVATGNVCRVAADANTSPIYLNYCFSRTADTTNAAGVTCKGVSEADPSAAHLHFCNFERCQDLSQTRYVVATRAKATGFNTSLLACNSKTVIIGSDLWGQFTASGTGFEFVINAFRSDVTVKGTRVTCKFSNQNQDAIRCWWNNTGNKVMTLRHVLLRTLATNAFSNLLNLHDNSQGGTQSMDLINVLIDTDGSMSIQPTAAASLADGCRFKRASAPANFASKVTAGTNTFSNTALDLDSYDVPTSGGNCNAGVDPGYVGSIDINGLPFLGGTFVQGCAERPEVRANAFLYPVIW